MRVSAAGWLYDSMERTREVARATANVTHNHPEGIKGAEATASAIYMARNGSSKEEIKTSVRRLNRLLVPKGLRILPLRYAGGKALIYVYRPARLQQDLTNYFACSLLREKGYPCGHPERCVAQLIRNLRDSKDFPHEIGLFLGYPPEDVQGFIQDTTGCCKCTGYWKVYGDPERAQKLFRQYKKCTDVYYAHWSKGTSIERLTVAV